MSAPSAWYGAPYDPVPAGPPEPPDHRHTTGPRASLAPKDADTNKHVGVILGRFRPPHLGHLHVVEEAFARCGLLHVLSPRPPEGQPRWTHANALENAFGDLATTTHIMNSGPADRTFPAFASSWASCVKSYVPNVTRLFSSDANGAELVARALGVEHVLIDVDRAKHPISSTKLRADIYAHFHWLAPGARPQYAFQIGIVGPECAGKTTLARELSSALSAPVVDDQLRLEAAGAIPDHDAFVRTLRYAGSLRAEAARGSESGVIISDNSALTASLWAKRLGLKLSSPALRPAQDEWYDCWLVCHDDFGYVGPVERDEPDKRAAMSQSFRTALADKKHVVEIRGTDGPARVETALAAIKIAMDEKKAALAALLG